MHQLMILLRLQGNRSCSVISKIRLAVVEVGRKATGPGPRFVGFLGFVFD